MSRFCIAIGCKEILPSDAFLCDRHWVLLYPSFRREVNYILHTGCHTDGTKERKLDWFRETIQLRLASSEYKREFKTYLEATLFILGKGLTKP